MSQKIRASSSKFALLTRKRFSPMPQAINRKPAMLIKKDGRIRCLECKGFPSLKAPTGLQKVAKGKSYYHMPDCSARELF